MSDSELSQQIEKARKAQQENLQRHDVQLELVDPEIEENMERYLWDYTPELKDYDPLD